MAVICMGASKRGGKRSQSFPGVVDSLHGITDREASALRRLENERSRHGCFRKGKGNGNGAVEALVRVCHNAGTRTCNFDEGPGHDRVRNPCRRAGRDSHPGNHGLQAKAAGAVERNCGRYKRAVRFSVCEKGQSTVEFAVVTAGFLSATVALSLLWHAFGDGMLVEHALAVASHHIQAVFPTTIADIFLY